MQIATSILLGCELWNASGVLAWTTPPQQTAPRRPYLLAGLQWCDPSSVGGGEDMGLDRVYLSLLGRSQPAFQRRNWVGVKSWPVALAKLLVWALTFYIASLLKFKNLHLVCWTVSAKENLEKVDAQHSGISHMQSFDFSVWNVFLLKELHFGVFFNVWIT